MPSASLPAPHPLRRSRCAEWPAPRRKPAVHRAVPIRKTIRSARAARAQSDPARASSHPARDCSQSGCSRPYLVRPCHSAARQYSGSFFQPVSMDTKLFHPCRTTITRCPNINPPGRGAVKYTPDLFEQFQKRWGYDLKTHLPSLLEETGDWRRIRHNYYALLLELFIDRWSKPWHDYAESKHIAWTGHYWEHAWPNPGEGPDNMAMYAWQQIPGIDMLFNQFSEQVNSQFGNVRSVKELASAANQIGQRRTLSETYGGGGWDLRFEDMKRLGDWEYALGVNVMNQHLSFGTITGARKYDYPQSFSYHEPWWNHYGVLANYFARLSLALSSGDEVARTLVIEPTTSAWMYAAPRPNERMMQIGEAFQEFVTRLAHRQVEFDLGSENIIKDHGRVDGKQFVVGKRSYDVVILPPGTENLDGATARLVRKYMEAGGKLTSYVSGELLVDGAPGGFPIARSAEEPANPEITRVEGAMLFHQRRRLKDGELWFFANSSLEAPAGAI